MHRTTTWCKANDTEGFSDQSSDPNGIRAFFTRLTREPLATIKTTLKDFPFFVSIFTDGDLSSIESPLAKSGLGLELYRSGYNGKIIIQATPDNNDIEWNMDSSNTDEFVATGNIKKTMNDSIEYFQKLSSVLVQANLNHEIVMDCDDGSKTFKIKG